MQAIINILNSLVGYFVAVLLVVIAAVIVGYSALTVQQSTATSYYTIDSQSLRANSKENKEAFRPLSGSTETESKVDSQEN